MREGADIGVRHGLKVIVGKRVHVVKERGDLVGQ